MGASLVLRFSDRASLMHEHAQNLAFGRAFVAGASGHELFSTCTLVLEHPDTGSACSIAAEVVMVVDEGKQPGVALQFKDRSQAELTRVANFVGLSSAAENDGTTRASGSVALDYEIDDEDIATNPIDVSEVGADNDTSEHADEELADTEEDEEAEGEDAEGKNLVKDRQLRLRNLPLAERVRVARGPNMEERKLLERIYGVAVWEHLLRNPKITVAEVARIAKKGTLPRPLVDLIVDNEGWIHQSIVRRALLGNPRLGADSATKVLRTLSQRELKLVPNQRAYPQMVRTAAARLLKK